MDMKKSVINGVMYTVTTINDYLENPSMYNHAKTLVEHNGYILPIRASASPTKNEVGAYVFSNEEESPFCYIVNDPETDEEKEMYNDNHVEDYSKAETTAELLRSRDNVVNMEREVLTSSDNITTLPIGDNDEPEAVIFKQALNSKHIDAYAYKCRMGPSHKAANNFRQITASKLSMKKLKELSAVYDLKMTLRAEDANPDVCNPMNCVLEIELTPDEDGNTLRILDKKTEEN